MTDSSYVSTDSEFSIIKLKNSLEHLANRADQFTDANTLLAEATALFKDFFTNLSDPEFKPKYLRTGDTPSSEIYNDNLRQIYNDISRFYTELNNLANANVKTFNFSQVVINEIKKRAASLASTVLDLNILNNFNRGDVIVAGDDFLNLDFVDSGAGLGSFQAELISNGSGMSLARSTTNNISSRPKVKIDIIPISPISSGTLNNQVNTSPTIGNYNRFYEGNYYNFLGRARPEGGAFNIQYAVNPKDLKQVTEEGEENTQGIFLEYGALEEDKEAARLAMLDNNPDTFWECEYVVPLTNPLIPDVTESAVVEEEVEASTEIRQGVDNAPNSAAIQIDVEDLNNRAIQKDLPNTDLVIDIVITLPQEENVNFVSINPVVFSNKAFIEVVDIATVNNSEGEFRTVDNWDAIRFPKTITPEANEFLTDSQLAATLSPSRYNYTGQGIYPFPTRIASKVKIRLTMAQPVSQIYEKTYALLKNTVDVKVTTTTTTRKGALRF